MTDILFYGCCGKSACRRQILKCFQVDDGLVQAKKSRRSNISSDWADAIAASFRRLSRKLMFFNLP